MPARRRPRKGVPFNSDECRAKIQATLLIHRLHKCAMGEVELTNAQVRAIDILLKKVIPDLSQTQIVGEVDVRYVVELPPVLTREEWEKKFGHEIELKAITDGSGNGEAGNVH